MNKFIKYVAVTMLVCIAYKSVVAQSGATETVIVPAGGALDYRTAFGIKSVYKGAGNSSSSLTPVFELSDLKEGGFMVRNKFVFTKYTNDFKKLWDSEIEKKYSLGDFPFGEIVGNEHGTYFYELVQSETFSEATITQFDASGKTKQIKFSNNKRFTASINVFVTISGLNFLMCKVDTKTKTMKYFLCTFSHADLTESVVELELPATEHEVKAYTLTQNPKFLWHYEEASGDRIIFSKKYVKEEDAKNKELVVQTGDYSKSSKINIQNFKIIPTDGNVKIVIPALVVDIKNNWLYLSGLMSSKANNVMDMMYSFKYDITNAQKLKGSEISLAELNEKMGWNEKFKDKVGEVSFLNYAQSILLEGKINKENNNLSLYMDGGAAGLSRGKAWKYVFTLNEELKIEKIEELYYTTNPSSFSPYEIVPKFYTVLYKTSSEKTKAIEYVWKQSSNPDFENLFYALFDREGYRMLISVNDKTSEMKGIKLK